VHTYKYLRGNKMLQEVLLSLSGHPSPLFDSPSGEVNPSFPNLSPPELELLKRVGRLAKLHREVRSQLELIKTKHESPICKAVAMALSNRQLERFQRRILEVEESILKKDSKIVGAYNIVPLAALVGEFDEWPRLMEWIWQLTTFILPPKDPRSACSGSGLINHLRSEAQTGYPDIGEAALQLSKVAELAWLRQLSNWLLFGQLPTFGFSDFCIQSITEGDEAEFEILKSKLPNFVSDSTASSILFIGKSLRQISIRTRENPAYLEVANLKSEMELIPEHQQVLSRIEFPISPASISDAVNTIRYSISKQVLQKLLPVEKVLQLMNLLKEFFLLSYGEFAISLIREADERLSSRSKQSSHSSGHDSLKSMAIKSGEVTTILRKTWNALSTLVDEEDELTDLIEMGRDLIHLSSGRAIDRTEKHEKRKSMATSHFNDFLLPVATHLSLSITSPFDLFISQSEVKEYSDLNMYLLSIRRGHIHLSDLWKQSSIRKDHPTPKSCAIAGADVLAQQRERRHKRFVEMRKVWATCSASVYLLSELGEYFEGQVIPSLWNSLLEFINKPPKPVTGTDSLFIPAATAKVVDKDISSPLQQSHDPATLSKAHKVFIDTLSCALLYSDTSFTTALRDFLRSIDDLIAQILRLQSIQVNLDLEEDDGIFDALTNYQQDLNECWAELDRARKRVDGGSRAVVTRLREFGESGQSLLIPTEASSTTGGYQPVNGAKIERLLMKLETGRTSNDEMVDDINEED
jgi:Gamma tubulin complex component N-terminal/Gamma tubulin complex component C-terminal